MKARVFLWLGLLAVVLAAAGAAFVYSGVYDVSATDNHLRPTYWTIRTAMERSVGVRASRVQVPALDDASRARRGLAVFREHCVRCHGAPGVPPEPFALGLMPVPENLAHVANVWSAAEIYWTVRNGLKMTGMPAWQYRLAEDEIWDVVAFVKTLPSLSPEEYEGLREGRAPRRAPPESPVDAKRGRRAIEQYACVTCHAIPGVVGSQAPVGPSLARIASRSFIAGVLPNTMENMALWLIAPQDVKPGTAMPDLDLSARDAKDIAAYLSTLN
ncbi:MAG: c-type cytochrome [Burkholderiales bacterium]